jgi:hypothetical protein
VPDLNYAIELHHGGRTREALGFFFAESNAGYYRQHRYMYDYDTLAGLLRECGFSAVNRREYRTGLVPDLELLDNRPEETLYVEAASDQFSTSRRDPI